MPLPNRLNFLKATGRRKQGWSKALNATALTDESKRCLRNLAAYTPPPPPTEPDLRYPLSRTAAVLVPLFVGRSGDLYVVLSRCVFVRMGLLWLFLT